LALSKAGLKYELITGRSFFDKKEIRLLLDYLRLVANPLSIIYLRRTVKTPSRGVGDKTLAHFEQWMSKTRDEMIAKGRPYPSTLDHLYAIRLLLSNEQDQEQEGPGSYVNDDSIEDTLSDYQVDEQLHQALAQDCPLSQREKRSLHSYALIITSLHELAHRSSAHAVASRLASVVGVGDYIALISDDDDDKQSRLENVQELLALAEFFHQEGGERREGGGDLWAFMEYLSTYLGRESAEVDAEAGLHTADSRRDVTKLMTIHSAKGLEFDVVVVCGFDDGTLPHILALNDPERPVQSLIEERNLAYVAVTRARSVLILTSRKRSQRVINGKVQSVSSKTSRFLDPLKELPPSVCTWIK
jgi:DNA helicase II / ATP-dependent DNA helicase PcrA